MRAIIEAEVAQAKAVAKEKCDPLISNNARLKNIRSNREAELAALTVEALAGHLGSSSESTAVDVTPEKPLAVEQKAFRLVDELFTTTNKK